LGFVFHPDSPRYIMPGKVAEIISKLPPFLTTVGLFVNATEDSVRSEVEASGVDLIQFHGDEEDDYCRSFNYPYLKAIRVSADTKIPEACSCYPYASGILLDTFVSTVYGGSGETFDWNQVPGGMGKPVVLAGGLTTSNVSTAIRLAQPYAVDVSSGVESAKGKKDKQKMLEFVNAVKGCD
jgi:phosphoribosylanthranilate isomerase